MPQQEGFERRVVSRSEKPFQQQSVGQIADRPGGEQRAKMTGDSAPRPDRHEASAPRIVGSFQSSAAASRTVASFWANRREWQWRIPNRHGFLNVLSF
jgi:hypothetical protein